MVEFRTSIDDVSTCDVLVIGGGPGGIASALAAARNGARTVLIEREGCVGGMATIGLVGPFMTSFDGSGKTQIIRGIFDELVRRLEKEGGAIHPSKIGKATPYAAFIRKGHEHVTPFDSEKLKIVAEDMLLEAGVTLIYYTDFVDTIMDGENIDYVVVAKRQGPAAIKARIYIDATGDASVAEKAGVPTSLGREEDGHSQPATLFFRVCNVDSEKVYAYVDENKELMGKPFFGVFSWLIKEGRKTGEWTIARDEMGTYETCSKGEWKLNTTRIQNIDGTKSEDLTKATIDGRKQVQQVYSFLRNHVPGFENAKLMDTASVVGCRETRHIKGLYTITKEDVIRSAVPDDVVLLCSNSIDIHDAKTGAGEYITVDRWYGIPYRALVPQNCRNLLVAGKTISATSDAVSAFRVMPCCYGIGEAAGAAAALCVRDDTAPADLPYGKLREVLLNENVFLGD